MLLLLLLMMLLLLLLPCRWHVDSRRLWCSSWLPAPFKCEGYRSIAHQTCLRTVLEMQEAVTIATALLLPD